MGKLTGRIIGILLVVAAAAYVVFERPIQLGLDLKGGTQLTLQATPTEQVSEITPDVMVGLESVLEQRINGLGVAEAVLQISGEDRLFVQLPGVEDPDRAIDILGDTAQLEFRRQLVGTTIPFDPQTGEPLERLENPDEVFERTELTGAQLTNAIATPTSNRANPSWQVELEFDTEGATLFAELTQELAGTGRSLGIFLDETLISAPSVGPEFAQTGIIGGRAVISSSRFDVDRATDLATKLRAGALPVPVNVIENRTVGATLGAASVRRSLIAGLGGLALTFGYMLVYYQLPGLMASLALLIYALITFATFQLLGVTLTLPGIAGFILSIGIAVDANVLIFERTREELRNGKSVYKSVEEGFSRALASILDSNVTTLIACLVLFWLGVGLVKGFALTLAIGILVSFFTALTCTRTLLLVLLSQSSLRKPEIFGIEPEIAK
ncbi:protein translocase subunit SecD [Synechococcus sp. PCC 7336]|uniref:protein translocase subunit SecD n=1 Tax=Synechococcus sp. PCC 7336 TaxID=195250 RepID=UPI0004755027|nr:protein translocase subunit SecD [Synechococcus sp. PCC 7336]